MLAAVARGVVAYHYEQDARITADGKCAAWEGRRSIISVTDGFTRSERTAPGAPPLESMRAVLEYGLLLEERALPGAWVSQGWSRWSWECGTMGRRDVQVFRREKKMRAEGWW